MLISSLKVFLLQRLICWYMQVVHTRRQCHGYIRSSTNRQMLKRSETCYLYLAAVHRAAMYLNAENPATSRWKAYCKSRCNRNSRCQALYGCSGSTSSPNSAFFFASFLSFFLSLAALFFARLASMSSLICLSRAFSALALWICKTLSAP